MAKATSEGLSDNQIDAQAKDFGQQLADGEKVTIKLPIDDRLQDPQPVGINGYFYHIKRGEKVEVPLAVKEILENAGLL
jgi:hypothetical protein